MQVNPFPFKRSVRIEMVPLIDCFFLLLVFFIFGVFSMTMQQGILVDLPAAQTATVQQEDTVTVSLTADGSVFVNQESVAMEVLAGRLQEAQRTRPHPLVILQADRQVPHGRVVDVLDAIRQAGLQRVSVQASSEPT
ncbi:MAG: biopolymer transporter ExbD [Candidatus Omnitrophota bacterium]|nr:biopolymer transporter ExbD [Candidatus Omnitrophota bacterium]